MARLERRITPITNEALKESFPNIASTREARKLIKESEPTGYEYLLSINPSDLDILAEREEVRGVKRAGEIIKEIRIEMELRQSDLADQCGFDRALISYLENGKSRPHASNLLKITRGLDLNLSQTIEVFLKANYRLPKIKPQNK